MPEKGTIDEVFYRSIEGWTQLKIFITGFVAHALSLSLRTRPVAKICAHA